MCAISRTDYAGGIIGNIGGFTPGDFAEIAVGEAAVEFECEGRGVRIYGLRIYFDNVARTVYSPSSPPCSGRTKYRDESRSAGSGSTG